MKPSQTLSFMLLLASLSWPFLPLQAQAVAQAGNISQEKLWGIALGGRWARIALGKDPEIVKDTVPKLYYEGDTLYLRGEYGGLHFYQLSTTTRLV